jgi:hypothetical protein
MWRTELSDGRRQPLSGFAWHQGRDMLTGMSPSLMECMTTNAPHPPKRNVP